MCGTIKTQRTRTKGSKTMIRLANGEHTFFTTDSGVRYWVMNLYGTYRVEREGKVRKVTEEIKKAIELV